MILTSGSSCSGPKADCGVELRNAGRGNEVSRRIRGAIDPNHRGSEETPGSHHLRKSEVRIRNYEIPHPVSSFITLTSYFPKAHPRVCDLFLQVFDDGRLTDSKGRTSDARNALFIMTSNIATSKEESKHAGFQPQTTETGKGDTPRRDAPFLPELRGHFRPEFINRIDEQFVFRSLNQDDVGRILDLMLREVCDQLHQQHGVFLKVGAEARELMIRTGYSPAFGARELRRAVERLLQVPLSQLILNGELAKHGKWRVELKGQELVFEPA